MKPVIDRSVTLHFRGDWGRANLHRALGWLSNEMVNLSGPHTRVAIWNGTARWTISARSDAGKSTCPWVTPGAFTAMALDGRGAFAGERLPHLRALGYVPQNDRLILAIRSEFGIRSFDDLRRKKPALRIAAGLDDGNNFMGMATQNVMQKSGIPRAELERWGGRYIEHGSPKPCVDEVMNGHADAVFQEAVMTNWWQQLANKIDLNFIPIEPGVRDALRSELGWPSATLPKGYMRGTDEDMEFLDFSHFLLLTTSALPDDIAYAIAWSLIERWNTLEEQYRHIPPERSPVSYPPDDPAIGLPDTHPAAPCRGTLLCRGRTPLAKRFVEKLPAQPRTGSLWVKLGRDETARQCPRFSQSQTEV